MGEFDSTRKWACILAATGVAAGAFGAHALKAVLTERGTLQSWHTAVNYQLLHSIVLLAIATREVDRKSTVPYTTASNLFIAGICMFSGSIYGLSLGGPKILGPITPIGGLLMIAGWVTLGIGSEGGPSK